MKLIGFWLLLLLAVLVPATATVAAAMVCPPVSVAKQGQVRSHVVQAKLAKAHGASTTAKHHGRSAQAKVTQKKAALGEKPADHCCDADPCSHCASCGTCASMALAMFPEFDAPLIAVASLPEPGDPRAEFLLAGQERPPRIS